MNWICWYDWNHLQPEILSNVDNLYSWYAWHCCHHIQSCSREPCNDDDDDIHIARIQWLICTWLNVTDCQNHTKTHRIHHHQHPCSRYRYLLYSEVHNWAYKCNILDIHLNFLMQPLRGPFTLTKDLEDYHMYCRHNLFPTV